MSDLLKSVEQSIAARSLLRLGQSVLVAVSGGADSMVLLALLHELSRKNRWRLTVAHCNHQLRGRSSDADEQFVRRIAQKRGISFVSERANVKAVANAEKLSVEMAARKLRHEFLARVAKRLKIQTIALAHHADDQLELFFLRLLRGSGSEGLTGMKWRVASPANSNIQLIRPLLEFRKAELLAHATANRIHFREDATNAALDFQRNRIRHELLPLLRRKYQPTLEDSILRVQEILGTEGDFVGEVATVWLKHFGPQAFEDLHVAVQRRCLQLQLFDLGIAGDFNLIEKLRGNTDRPVMIGPNRLIVRDSMGRLAVRNRNLLIPEGDRLEIDLTHGAGELAFGGKEFSWKIRNGDSRRLPSRINGRELFDADKVGSLIILRHWVAGDRFHPIGMPHPVKLQDLFVNQKIPRESRHQLVVATTTSGELFWVEKLRISEGFKVSDRTIRRLLWQWKLR